MPEGGRMPDHGGRLLPEAWDILSLRAKAHRERRWNNNRDGIRQSGIGMGFGGP